MAGSSSTRSWDSCVVIVGGSAWDHVRTSERFLADEIAKVRPVLWVDPPASVLRARQAGRPLHSQFRQVNPGTFRLTPTTVPGVTRLILEGVATAQCRAAIHRALRRLHATPAAVIVVGTIDLLGVVPEALKILYGTDDWVAGAALMGLDTRRVERAEARQLRRADVVLAVSEPLAERWSTLGAEPIVLPNGADVEAMRKVDTCQPADDVRLPAPIAGVVGQISARIDLSLLQAVADRGVSLLVVGPVISTAGAELAGLTELASRPNVMLAGARPFESLPTYYRTMSVGLTPYRNTEFNNASFPLKTLEYLAAGLPVVSTDLRANRLLDTDLVQVCSEPRGFADLVVAAVHAPPDPESIAARRALAAKHSWANRAQRVLQIISDSHP